MTSPESSQPLPGQPIFGGSFLLFAGNNHERRLYADTSHLGGLYVPLFRIHSERPELWENTPEGIAHAVINKLGAELLEELYEHWPTFP